MKTLFPLIVTNKLEAAANFYRDLFGMTTLVDVGWYVQLQHPDNPSMQIAVMRDDHDSVPESHRTPPAGVIVTLEFDDVDSLFARVHDAGLPVISEPRDEEWGQRHFITEDPSGLLVDVVKPIPPTAEFLERHGLQAGSGA